MKTLWEKFCFQEKSGNKSSQGNKSLTSSGFSPSNATTTKKCSLTPKNDSSIISSSIRKSLPRTILSETCKFIVKQKKCKFSQLPPSLLLSTSMMSTANTISNNFCHFSRNMTQEKTARVQVKDLTPTLTTLSTSSSHLLLGKTLK